MAVARAVTTIGEATAVEASTGTMSRSASPRLDPVPIVTLIARPIQAAMLRASPTSNRPLRDTLTTAAKGRMSHARTQASQAVGDALATKQSGASAKEPRDRASRVAMKALWLENSIG